MFHIYFLGSSEGLIFDVANANFDVALWNPLRAVPGVARRAVPHRCFASPRWRPVRAFVCTATREPTSTATAWCWPPTWRACSASSTARPVSATTTGAPRIAAMAHRTAVRRAAAVAGPAGTGRPAGVPGDGRASAAGQRQRARTLRTRGGRLGRAAPAVRSSNCTPTPSPGRARGSATACSPGCTSSTRKPKAPASSTNACCAAATARASRRATTPTGRPYATPHPGLMLAGDGIRIDLPVALMERAATTGWSAANHLLAHYGLAGHALHTVPIQGRSPTLRRLAARKAVGAMSMLAGLKSRWSKTSPFKVLPRRTVGRPATHLPGRRARDHRRRAGALAAQAER